MNEIGRILGIHGASPAADGRPKYVVLREALLALIAEGHWRPGDRLPTEAELAQELPYSLGTIQKAIGSLVDDGLVVRRRGAGSFVAPSREMPDPLHARFLDDQGRIMPIFPHVDVITQVASERLKALFATDAPLFRIDRTLSVGGEFTVRNRFYIPAERAQALLALPRETLDSANFKLLLTRDGRLRIARIEQLLRQKAESLHSEVEQRLAKATVLVVEARAYDPDGGLIYLLEMLVPETSRTLVMDTNL